MGIIELIGVLFLTVVYTKSIHKEFSPREPYKCSLCPDSQTVETAR